MLGSSCKKGSTLKPEQNGHELRGQTDRDGGQYETIDTHKPDFIDISEDPSSQPGSEDYTQTQQGENADPL